MKKTVFAWATVTIIAAACEYKGIEPEPVPDCSTTVSFSNTIKPVIDTNCALSSCHGGSQSPDLRSYSQVYKSAEKIKLRTSNRTMPIGRSLTTAEIAAIACWVEQGAMNN